MKRFLVGIDLILDSELTINYIVREIQGKANGYQSMNNKPINDFVNYSGGLNYRPVPIRANAHILAVEINDFLPSQENGRARSRAIPNILHLLDHVDKHRIETNFYITPELLKDFPEVVSLVSSRGHEIGICLDFTNGACHSNLTELKDELAFITENHFLGAMFKGNPGGMPQYLRKLASTGYRYCLVDALPKGIGPVGNVINVSFEDGSEIAIFPPSKSNFAGIKMEFGQSGKIRLFPLWFLRRCLREFSRRNIPAVLNFPLWEFDPHIPRRVTNPISNIRNYGNLTWAEFKLTRLLLEFDFVKIPQIIAGSPGA